MGAQGQHRAEAALDHGRQFPLEVPDRVAAAYRAGDDPRAVAAGQHGGPVGPGAPLSGTGLAAARAAFDRDEPGRALTLFLREVVRMPAPLAWLAGFLVGRHPKYRRRVVRQLDDNDALDALGVRLAAYARLDAPARLARAIATFLTEDLHMNL